MDRIKGGVGRPKGRPRPFQRHSGIGRVLVWLAMVGGGRICPPPPRGAGRQKSNGVAGGGRLGFSDGTGGRRGPARGGGGGGGTQAGAPWKVDSTDGLWLGQASGRWFGGRTGWAASRRTPPTPTAVERLFRVGPDREGLGGARFSVKRGSALLRGQGPAFSKDCFRGPPPRGGRVGWLDMQGWPRSWSEEAPWTAGNT